MLRFPANGMARPLEDFLQQARESPLESLAMPIQFQPSSGLGGAVVSVQAVATWATSSKQERILRLPSDFATNDNSRSRFASTLQGMSALYFSDSIFGGSVPYSRLAALRGVTPHISAMQAEDYRNTLRGPGAALCCFMGARNEFLHPLYSKPTPGSVRDQSDFRILLARIFNGLGTSHSSVSASQLDYLSVLVYQLFLNADEHGSNDESGMRFDRGMRGISVRITTFTDFLSLIDRASDDDALRYFITRTALAEPSRTRAASRHAQVSDSTRIMEICVFDTGPGLALKWLSDKSGVRSYDDISPGQELEAVQTCFLKHATTKVNQLKGQGLSMALKALTELNAFVALRTGRLSLYQDLSRSDTSDFKPIHRFRKTRKLERIAGTSYSIYFRVQ